MLSRRTLLASSLALAALPARAAAPDAVVGPGGRYATVRAALDAAPKDGSRYTIAIGETTLREKVTIDRANTLIYGLSPNSRITWDDYSGRTDPANPSTTLGTRRTATVTIAAPDVTIRNLAIVNTFDYLGQIGLADGDPNKVHDTQALALAVSGRADRIIIKNVRLDGWQDTLFVDCGKTYIGDSRISGSVDFIFGAGTVALERCEVVSRYMPGKPGQGYVCAPSTLKETPYGFVFFDCRLTHEGEPFPDGSTALARPWRPTTSFPDGRYGNPDVQSACLYLRCALGDHIAVKGFDHMSYNTRDGAKAFNEPQDARFFIFDCNGKAVAGMPANFIAPRAMVDGLTPETLLGLAL